MLHVHPKQSGDDVLCYLAVPEKDPALYDTSCDSLLVNLQGNFANSRELLDAGGNFGCLVSKNGLWDLGRRRACRNNQEHSLMLSKCKECSHMFVCIWYPESVIFPTPSPAGKCTCSVH